MDLNDLVVYQRAMRVGETVWSMVEPWPPFARRTIGYQLVRSADSIAANISEGHGRYHYGENRQYCYYSRGSIQETLTWLRKACSRGLLSQDDFNELSQELITVRRMLNGYIRSIGRNR
jgi:four helix bundle protein